MQEKVADVKMQEKVADVNFALLSRSRNKIGRFIKTYLHRPIKISYSPIPPPPPKKAAPTSFSPVTFTNIGISSQKFLTFNFNPFCHTSVKLQART